MAAGRANAEEEEDEAADVDEGDTAASPGDGARCQGKGFMSTMS